MFVRKVIKIAGESGMGMESSGMIVMKSLKEIGFHIHGEREFPSLIKGGRANIQINFSNKPVYSMSEKIDIGIGLDREGVVDCLETLAEGGVLIHGFERWSKVIKNLSKIASEKKLQVFPLPARQIAEENGGNNLMTNVVLLGFLWKVMGLDLEILKSKISLQFAKKPALVPINLSCVEAGFNFSFENLDKPKFELFKPQTTETKNHLLIDGNSAIGVGAVEAGVRAYYAYPMSPSTSVLVYLAQIAQKTGMMVKQAEDEITVAQLTLGSMHAGTRAICATSGGGYDLMTETISLSAMIETPWVCVLAQRPGPATGLPTWTAQADLNLAVYAGHGEFARVVIACSDKESCFLNIQKALNLAEQFQIPVTVLTEATIAMSYTSAPIFSSRQVPIQRYLTLEKASLEDEQDLLVKFDPTKITEQNFIITEKLESKKRFELTQNGVSSRWLPGTSKTVYFANGDEHDEEGGLTEEAEPSQNMIEKRIKKIEAILEALPEPEIFYFDKDKGNVVSDSMKKLDLNILSSEAKVLIGWGSTKNSVLDSLQILQDKQKIYYLHYNFVWPLKVEKILKLEKNGCDLKLLEGNYQGQLGELITKKTGIKFKPNNCLFKWNGRPFFVEEILSFVS